jgi:hypothetical protein
MRPAREIIDRFGQVEDDQKYTRLVELFTDDAIYYDPFAGAQVGKAAIYEFMSEMERVIPTMGVYFANWETCADTHVGWAKWNMVVPVNGVEHPIPGQSIYRLRDGKVCFVADYVDAPSYERIRSDRRPNAASAALVEKGNTQTGQSLSVVTEFWNQRMTSWSPVEGGTVSVNDLGIEDSVAWVQWTCHTTTGDFPGWTLHNIDGDRVSSEDYWDDARN